MNITEEEMKAITKAIEKLSESKVKTKKEMDKIVERLSICIKE